MFHSAVSDILMLAVLTVYAARGYSDNPALIFLYKDPCQGWVEESCICNEVQQRLLNSRLAFEKSQSRRMMRVHDPVLY